MSTLYEMSAGLAGLSRELVGCGRLFSRIGVKDGVAASALQKIGVVREEIDRLVWVEPDPDVYRVLDTIHRPGTCLAVAETIRDWSREATPAQDRWCALIESPPQEPIVALAALFVRLAWSWKGEGKHFAEQRTFRDGIAVDRGPKKPSDSQAERVLLSTLADRLERHASASWPDVLLLRAKAEDVVLTYPAPRPGDHVNIDRPYAKTTKYPGKHDMSDDKLLNVCRWALEVGASASVHEGHDLSLWLFQETGTPWRAVDLKPSRHGADPRFSKTGEWLMLSGESR